MNETGHFQSEWIGLPQIEKKKWQRSIHFHSEWIIESIDVIQSSYFKEIPVMYIFEVRFLPHCWKQVNDTGNQSIAFEQLYNSAFECGTLGLNASPQIHDKMGLLIAPPIAPLLSTGFAIEHLVKSNRSQKIIDRDSKELSNDVKVN